MRRKRKGRGRWVEGMIGGRRERRRKRGRMKVLSRDGGLE
jgi:hypothetical protein